MKTKTLYQIREYTKSDEYSISLSSKLKTREVANKLIKRLKKQGRIVFKAPYKVAI